MASMHDVLKISDQITALPVITAGLFFYLFSIRHTPLGDIRVALGDPLPAFSALTPSGAPFSSAELAGQRVLLKFFRGHW